MAHVSRIMGPAGEQSATDADLAHVTGVMESYGRQGLRVLALARRVLPAGAPVPASREDAERDLCLLGVTAMQDPPRAEVPAAIARVHRARIRVHVVTGDNGLTAAAIARQVGIVACQVGTAFAVRTDRASLRQVGVFSNKPLLAAIAVALAFAAAVVYLPVMHTFFGTAALSGGQLATVAPFPFIIWGADEIRRALLRRRPG